MLKCSISPFLFQESFENFHYCLLYFCSDKTVAIYCLAEVYDWNEGMLNRLKNREAIRTVVEYDMQQETVWLLQVAASSDDLQQAKKYCCDLLYKKKKSIEAILRMINQIKSTRRQVLAPMEVRS